MANTGGKIAVLVVDGNSSALRELGFPFPAMQEAGVQLEQACWDVKLSPSGMSFSFFWPHSSQTELSSNLKSNSSKSKKRRISLRRKRSKNNAKKNDNLVTMDQVQPVISTDAHLAPVKMTLDDFQSTEIVEKDNIHLSDADDSDVFYLERSNVPGVCVESKLNKSLSWTTIKISRRQVKAVADSDPNDDDDVCLDDFLSIDYQPVNGKPGFLIETRDDEFWAPVAYRTRNRVRLKSVDTS